MAGAGVEGGDPGVRVYDPRNILGKKGLAKKGAEKDGEGSWEEEFHFSKKSFWKGWAGKTADYSSTFAPLNGPVLACKVAGQFFFI